MLQRLKCVDSLNESLSIPDTKAAFKRGSPLAEISEKIFLSHMVRERKFLKMTSETVTGLLPQEIIRLKYPTSLDKLKSSSTLTEFGLLFHTSKSIIILGAAIFLPHGENIPSADLKMTLSLCEHGTSRQGPFGRPLTSTSLTLTRKDQLDHADMCIEHEFGLKKKPEVICYPPPSGISSQRKYKRRCLGIHPFPVMFPASQEICRDRSHFLSLKIFTAGDFWAAETVWGGGGAPEVYGDDGVTFYFHQMTSRQGIRSSVTNGQIPILFYV